LKADVILVTCGDAMLTLQVAFLPHAPMSAAAGWRDACWCGDARRLLIFKRQLSHVPLLSHALLV
jgi:hypothetical protein